MLKRYKHLICTATEFGTSPGTLKVDKIMSKRRGQSKKKKRSMQKKQREKKNVTAKTGQKKTT